MITPDMLSGEWLLKEVRDISKKPPHKQDALFAKFFKRTIKEPLLNPSLCRPGTWPGACITNYHLDVTPDITRMYLVTDGKETISNYYDVSAVPDLIHLVPYVPLIRLTEELEVHSVPGDKTCAFKVVRASKTDLLAPEDMTIALFPLQDYHIFPRANLTRSRFLIPGECSFIFTGMPYPIFAMPPDIKKLYL